MGLSDAQRPEDPLLADPSCLGALTGASDQQMIAEVRGSLTTVFAEVNAWFDGPAEARALRPPDGGWTIDEVHQHLALTKHYLLLVIRNSTDRALTWVGPTLSRVVEVGSWWFGPISS